MFCPNCGKNNLNSSKFCESCGARLCFETFIPKGDASNLGVNTNNKNFNICAVIGFVFAILGHMLPFGWFLEFFAIIFGVVSRHQIKTNPNQRGDTLAFLSIIIGIVSIGSTLILIAFAKFVETAFSWQT